MKHDGIWTNLCSASPEQCPQHSTCRRAVFYMLWQSMSEEERPPIDGASLLRVLRLWRGAVVCKYYIPLDCATHAQLPLGWRR